MFMNQINNSSQVVHDVMSIRKGHLFQGDFSSTSIEVREVRQSKMGGGRCAREYYPTLFHTIKIPTVNPHARFI